MGSIKILFKKAYPTFKLALLEVVGKKLLNVADLKELGMRELFFVMAYPDTASRAAAEEPTSWTADGLITVGSACSGKQTLLVVGK